MASDPTPSQDNNSVWPKNFFFAQTGISSAPTNSANEVQNITINATGGSFTLSLDLSSLNWGSFASGAISYNANTTTMRTNIQTALDTAFGTSRVTIGGNNAPYTATFSGDFGGIDLPLMTASTTNLTGGAQTVTLATATAGSKGTLGRIAPKGAVLSDVDNAKLYINTGTDTTQTWTLVGSQS